MFFVGIFFFNFFFLLAKTAALLSNDPASDVSVSYKSSAHRNVATSFVIVLVLAKTFF